MFSLPTPTDNYAVKFIHKLQKLGSEEINGAIEETIIIKFWAAPVAFKLDSSDEYGGERRKGRKQIKSEFNDNLLKILRFFSFFVIF